MSRDPETVLDMPSTFKLALSLTAASAILVGSMFYKGQPAAQQPRSSNSNRNAGRWRAWPI
jgi:hypothetical protein